MNLMIILLILQLGSGKKVKLHVIKGHLCAISKNFVEWFWRKKFSKVCIKFSMFKLSLAII